MQYSDAIILYSTIECDIQSAVLLITQCTANSPSYNTKVGCIRRLDITLLTHWTRIFQAC